MSNHVASFLIQFSKLEQLWRISLRNPFSPSWSSLHQQIDLKGSRFYTQRNHFRRVVSEQTRFSIVFDLWSLLMSFELLDRNFLFLSPSSFLIFFFHFFFFLFLSPRSHHIHSRQRFSLLSILRSFYDSRKCLGGFRSIKLRVGRGSARKRNIENG